MELSAFFSQWIIGTTLHIWSVRIIIITHQNTLRLIPLICHALLWFCAKWKTINRNIILVIHLINSPYTEPSLQKQYLKQKTLYYLLPYHLMVGFGFPSEVHTNWAILLLSSFAIALSTGADGLPIETTKRRLKWNNSNRVKWWIRSDANRFFMCNFLLCCDWMTVTLWLPHITVYISFPNLSVFCNGSTEEFILQNAKDFDQLFIFTSGDVLELPNLFKPSLNNHHPPNTNLW